MIGLSYFAADAANRVAIAAHQGKQAGDTPLLRFILCSILPGRVLLDENFYASFWMFAAAETKLIDLVDRAHHLRKVDFRRGVKHGHRDKVAEYRKPQRPSWMSKQEYMKYPDVIRIRHVP
jgi:hypothetical protein